MVISEISTQREPPITIESFVDTAQRDLPLVLDTYRRLTSASTGQKYRHNFGAPHYRYRWINQAQVLYDFSCHPYAPELSRSVFQRVATYFRDVSPDFIPHLVLTPHTYFLNFLRRSHAREQLRDRDLHRVMYHLSLWAMLPYVSASPAKEAVTFDILSFTHPQLTRLLPRVRAEATSELNRSTASPESDWWLKKRHAIDKHVPNLVHWQQIMKDPPIFIFTWN